MLTWQCFALYSGLEFRAGPRWCWKDQITATTAIQYYIYGYLWDALWCPYVMICYDVMIYYIYCVCDHVCVYACVFACVRVCVCSNYLPEYVVSPMTNMCNHDPQMFPVPWQILAEGLRPGHLTDRHAQLTKLLQHRFGLSIQRGCFALGV